MRFVSLYGVFPRGYSKTYTEVLAMELTSIFYPGIELAMTAQTKENAAELIRDKHNEIMKHFPMLINEIKGKPKFSKNDAEVNFKSDSKIDLSKVALHSNVYRKCGEPIHIGCRVIG